MLHLICNLYSAHAVEIPENEEGSRSSEINAFNDSSRCRGRSLVNLEGDPRRNDIGIGAAGSQDGDGGASERDRLLIERDVFRVSVNRCCSKRLEFAVEDASFAVGAKRRPNGELTPVKQFGSPFLIFTSRIACQPCRSNLGQHLASTGFQSGGSAIGSKYRLPA